LRLHAAPFQLNGPISIIITIKVNINIKLNQGVEIPVLGAGTWRLKGEAGYRAIREALKIGYRHIDTAEHYENHEAIGRAIAESGIPREEIFITSKVWRDYLRTGQVKSECDRALRELQTDYIDLYLVHWPDRSIPISETLGAMEELRSAGKIRAFGVSNFTAHHIQDAIDVGFTPAVNQVEIHPSFGQPELRAYCKEKGVAVTAYSPLGQGQDLKLPKIVEIASRHGRSPAQVIINWLLARDLIAIPRSENPKYLADNFAALEWKLPEEDLKIIDGLDTGNRLINMEYSEFDY
jgi:2,5-diketo-D-gluconate reductase B